MTNPEQSPLEIQRRFAAVERRLTKLEMSIDEIDRIVDPQGWIGEAFEAMETHTDSRLDAVDKRLGEMDNKLDLILRHITGMNS